MEFLGIQSHVKNALFYLNNDDADLMYGDLNERAIAHQLAVKLSIEFAGFHVDCEYNGNAEQAKGRKLMC